MDLSYNCNNSCNNSCYNSCNNIDINNNFNLIWKNVYIKNKILYYLKLYNLFYNYRNFDSIEKLQRFKFKEFLNQIRLNFYDYNLSVNVDLSLIPKNIECIKLIFSQVNVSFSVTPKWIKTLDFYILNNNELSILKNAENIETLYLRNLIQNQNDSIKKDTLPKNLKKLFVCFNNTKSKIGIDCGALPESLTSLTIHNINSSNQIDNGILPSALKRLELNSSCAYFDIPSDFKLPPNLESLFISCKQFNFQLPIHLKELSLFTDLTSTSNLQKYSNLQRLTIRNGLNNEIPFDSLSIPNSLKRLKWYTNSIIDSCGKLIIPNNLEHLEFSHYFTFAQKYENSQFNQRLLPFQLPQSLTFISFEDNYGSFDNNNHPLIQDNIFPQSIKHINFGKSFNQQIELSKCINLKSLIFGEKFNQFINSDSLPLNLECITIKNQQYKHQITPLNENTLVKCYTIECYLQQFEINQESQLKLKRLCIPLGFKDSLSSLKLINKVNLEYLEIDGYYQPELPPLPNSIKTIVLSSSSNHQINLENFPNLETIAIKNDSNPTIKTSIIKCENQKRIYNFYNLKTIEITNPHNNKFIDSLDSIWYQFIKLKNINNNKQ